MNQRSSHIRKWWNAGWNTRRVTICVTGSVARGEETPHSDLDIFLIHESHTSAVSLNEAIIRRLHADFEHISVIARSLEEHEATVLDDVRSLTAQMDARYIAGDRSLFMRLQEQIGGGLTKHRDAVLKRLRELAVARHLQYGETVALLEPNIKNSAGALRDIHTMGYIVETLRSENTLCAGEEYSMTERMLSLNLRDKRIRELLSAYRFLLNVRRQMHACSGHLHDTLDFDLQSRVAETMGYGSREDKRAVESFMSDYYRHARIVHLSSELLFHDVLQTLREDDTLMRDSEETELSAVRVMEEFLHSCESGNTVSVSLMRKIDDHPQQDFTTNDVCRIFDAILRQPRHIAVTLSRMHELRILGRIIPEFSLLDHFFQHNIYHYFTADEHSLRAVHACEALRGSGEHVEQTLYSIEDLSVLYYALLLHDVAKPIDISSHEEIGAELVPDVLVRHGREDIIDDVVFLVRNHLVMEKIAFRRNIREIATIRSFAQLVSSRKRLDLLYVLTCCDMSALNPRVLTEWKKKLLAELYDITRNYLETGNMMRTATSTEYDAEPVSSMESRDFRTAVQDIFEGEQVRIHIAHHRVFSEVTVFCVDRPQLLAQLSAAFFGADTTIVDAMIETHNDVVIDVFRVIDIVSGKHLSSEQAHTLEHLIRDVCAGTLESEQLYRRYRRKWVRRLRNMPKTDVRLDVEYLSHTTDSGSEQTIIEVYAPDTFGLLYSVAGEISRFGLNVVFAKIATRVDGVVDSFYVVDEKGKPFTDEKRQKQLRQKLLSRITEITQ